MFVKLYLYKFWQFWDKEFDELDKAIWIVTKDCCYLYKNSINYNFGSKKGYIIMILKAIEVHSNNL